MNDTTNQSWYLAESARQVDGGVRLLTVQEALVRLAKSDPNSPAIAELELRAKKTLERWCKSTWMPGVTDLIQYFAAHRPSCGIPELSTYYKSIADSKQFDDVVQLAKAFLKENGVDDNALDGIKREVAPKTVSPAVCWISQAMALKLWSDLSKDLCTLARRHDLFLELRQLNESIKNYGKSVTEQRKRESRLPSILQNSRALQILQNIESVTASVQRSIAEIEVRSLEVATSSAFEFGAYELNMQWLAAEDGWPAGVMYQLLHQQDVAFTKLYGDGQQLIEFCQNQKDKIDAVELLEFSNIELSPLSGLSHRIILIHALLQRSDLLNGAYPIQSPRRLELAGIVTSVANILLGRFGMEVRVLSEPSSALPSTSLFEVEYIDCNEPNCVVQTGLTLLSQDRQLLTRKLKVKMPVRLHLLYSKLDEIVELLRESKPSHGAVSEKFANQIRWLKITSHESESLEIVAQARGWNTFRDDLVDLVRELELIQGSKLPDQLKRLVSEIFRILKTEGYVVERSFDANKSEAPWEFQVLNAVDDHELPYGRIIHRRLSSTTGELDSSYCLQVSGDTGKRPIAEFLALHKHELRSLQQEDSKWISEPLAEFFRDAKASLHGSKDDEIKCAVDFFGKLFLRCDREPCKLRYRCLCDRLRKTIEDDLGFILIPRVSPGSLELGAIDVSDKEKLDVKWQDGGGTHGKVLRVNRFSTPIEKGLVEASLGEGFPARLRKLLRLQENGATFKMPSALKQFEEWLQDLQSFRWSPQNFETQWIKRREKITKYADDSSKSKSEDWVDEWGQLVLSSSEESGIRQLFSIVQDEERWFRILPSINTETLTMSWPSDVETAARSIRVVPGGKAGDVKSVEKFGIRGVRTKVVIYGGNERVKLLDACDQLQTAITFMPDDLGFRIIRLLSAIRDPYVAPNSRLQPISVQLKQSLHHLVLETLAKKSIAPDKADSILERLLNVATELGYKDETWSWAFRTSAIEPSVRESMNLPFAFSDQTVGNLILSSFNVLADPLRILVSLQCSAGTPPPGYLQLMSHVQSISGVQVELAQHLRQALEALANDIATSQVTMQEQHAAEIWDLVHEASEKHRDAGSESQGGDSQGMMESAFELIDHFGLEAFGKPGGYMSSVAKNRDFETWFEFDRDKLAGLAGNSDGAIDLIHKVIRQGLRRKNASTPLRKAIVRL